VGGKRYRLSDKELELVLMGLLVLVNEAKIDDALCGEAIGLAERLAQCRPGRPGGSLSGEAGRLWARAERRAEAKRW